MYNETSTKKKKIDFISAHFNGKLNPQMERVKGKSRTLLM